MSTTDKPLGRVTHTPGPWALETVRTSCGICHKIGPFPGKIGKDGLTHACIYDDYPPNGYSAELEANAHLIAAAPDLLDALKDLFENPQFQVAIGGNPIMVDALMARARDAIAKATGAA